MVIPKNHYSCDICVGEYGVLGLTLVTRAHKVTRITLTDGNWIDLRVYDAVSVRGDSTNERG